MIVREPLRELGRMTREKKRAIVVVGFTCRLRGATQPHDRIDAFVAPPKSFRRLERPRDVLDVGVACGRNHHHLIGLYNSSCRA